MNAKLPRGNTLTQHELDTLTQLVIHVSIDDDEEMLEIIMEESWRDTIEAYLKEGVLPPDV